MIQRRLLSYILVLLFAFGQQQALVHPYAHLVSGQESSSQKNSSGQENSSSNKQIPAHSDVCGKCVALAGIGSAVGSLAHALLVSPTTFELAVFVTQSFFSNTTLPYLSRAPPHLA